MFSAKQIYLGRCAKAAPTARDYVQNGLIWQIDGIENAGYGVHESATTSWKDLIGNNNVSLSTTGQTINEKSVTFTPNGIGGILSSSITGVYALELCLSISRSNEAAVFTPVDTNRIVWYYNGSIGCGYGKRGFKSPISTPMTIYAEGSGSSFATKAKDGLISTPDGVTDSFNYITGVGFSFRGTAFPFGGEVFRGCIYSRALTAEEIAANYAIDKERFNLP